MQKIVINSDVGGFGISRKACEFMAARGNDHAKAELADYHNRLSEPQHADDFIAFSCIDRAEYYWNGRGVIYDFEPRGYRRDDPDLIAAMEELGDAVNGLHASLKIVSIPDDVHWYIHEDSETGAECVVENHRTWD